MSGAPIGEVFTAEVDGQERQYHILPRVFSAATLESLGRLYKKALRGQIQENLKIAAELRSTDPQVYEDFMRGVTKHATQRVVVGYDQAVEMLTTRDGMIAALVLNCPETPTQDEAVKLVEACENVMDLMSSLVDSGKEALVAAKNSNFDESLETEEILVQ